MDKVVRRKRPEPKKHFTPKFGNPGRDVEMIIRFSPYNGEVADWYGLSHELQEVLDAHFGGRFIDQKGVTVHVGIIIKDTGR